MYQTVGSWVRGMWASFAGVLGTEPGDPHEANSLQQREMLMEGAPPSPQLPHLLWRVACPTATHLDCLGTDPLLLWVWGRRYWVPLRETISVVVVVTVAVATASGVNRASRRR